MKFFVWNTKTFATTIVVLMPKDRMSENDLHVLFQSKFVDVEYDWSFFEKASCSSIAISIHFSIRTLGKK